MCLCALAPFRVATVAFVADSDDGLNLVTAPVDLDLFGTHLALVEAARRHGAGEHLERLGDLGRLAGTHPAARGAEAGGPHPPTPRAPHPARPPGGEGEDPPRPP